MSIVKYFVLTLVLLVSGRVIAQQDATNQTYEDYRYQWRNESLVETCPEGGLPPFSLEDPFLDARVKGAILKYTVHVPDPEWIEFQLFDYDCQIPIPTSSTAEDADGSPFVAKLEYSYALTNTAKLNLEINPYGLQEYGSLLYTETERSGQAPEIESRGTVRLCVRVSIWNGFPPSSSKHTSDVLEVTFVETQVTFEARFTVDDEQFLDFGSISATTTQRSECTGADCRKRMLAEESSPPSYSENPKRSRQLACTLAWGVQVFTCPSTIDLDSLVSIDPQDPPTNNDPVPDSGPVRLCIQPNAVAVEAGATLKDVEALYYDMDTGTYLLRQTGVESRFPSADGLTAKECGEQICIVETSLSRDFLRSQSVATLVAQGRVIFQPSQATVFNQVDVDFALEFEVARDDLFWSSSPARVGASGALLLVGLVIASSGATIFF
jgi:hypothetical protein